MANVHDRRYKKLFSNPILVQELLESFVKLPFVGELDFTTLEDTKKHFVTKEFEERESDLIYKVRYRGREAYIYLLLEFQSSVDPYMPMRILRYILEFYDDLTENFRVRLGKLPAVFPILLYNGDDRWTTPTNINKIIESELIDEAFIPNFSYFKIVENEFDEESLKEIKNAISAIFLIENTDFVQIKDKFEIIASLINEEKPEVIKLLRSWFINFLNKNEDVEALLETFDPLLEDKAMFAASVEKWEKIIEKRGIEQGIEQNLLENAKNLKAGGVPVETIVSCLKLPKEVVEKL